MLNASNSIFFQSLGCAKNLVDAEVMLGITAQDNYQVVSDPAKAQFIVVNTCSFIGDSRRESVNTILELARYKSVGSCKRLIVTGCLPQRYREDLKASFPEVDAFVGTGQYADILRFLKGDRESDRNFRHPKYIHQENTPRLNSQPFYRAYLKISEGCIKNCAFCIIPKIRGTLRSRTIASLVEEARRLVDAGAVELNLIAQDLTDYGRDLRDGSNLEGLLRTLVTIDGLRWIRLLYVYPDELSDGLLDLIATESKICKYIDTPIQHIADEPLRLMNRKVTGSAIRRRIMKFGSEIRDISIRSTVIVGYPGETEAQFEELRSFVEEAQFDHLGVFAYSREEGTAAYSLPDQLPEELKQRRRSELMELQKKISLRRLGQRVGRVLPVLVEEPSMESEYLISGRLEGQANEVDGCVLIRGGNAIRGKIQDVVIEKALEYDLVGSVV